MAHGSTFQALAQTVREVRAMQAGRLRHLDDLATKVAEKGELPTFDLDGLRVQLVQLYEVEELLTRLIPHEPTVRALEPALMRAP